MRKALILVDIQNEYSNEGNLPVINFNEIIANINTLDTSQYDLVIAIIHQNQQGLFSKPWNIDYPPTLSINIDYELIKSTADSFQTTDLNKLLIEHHINCLDICGMMTQNCITYTALSALNLDYQVQILSDLCGSVDSTVHNIALRALASKTIVI